MHTKTQRRPLVNEMTTYQRQLSAPPEDVDSVHDFLQIIWNENPEIPAKEKIRVETAIIELAANIILYSEATTGVIFNIIVNTSKDKLEASISDNGELFSLELDSHIMPEDYAESGRGIPMVKSLVDKFEFDASNGRNTWRIWKEFHS